MRFTTTIGIGAVLVGTACMDAVPVAPEMSAAKVAVNSEVEDAAVGGYRARQLPLAPEQVGSSEALAVNNRGVAGGYAFRRYSKLVTDFGTFECPGVTAATLYDGPRVISLHADVLNALGRYGGIADVCLQESYVTDINDRSEAVGFTRDWRPYAISGFFWSPDSGARILTRDDGPSASLLAGINNDGIVVGHWIDYITASFALRWNTRSGVVQDVPQFDWIYNVTVWDISESGSVVGCAGRNPFFADGLHKIRIRGYDCGGYSAWSFPRGGVNTRGTVVFNVSTAGPMRWQPLTGEPPTSIGWGPGVVMDVSDAERIVGWRTQAAAPTSVAMTQLADGSPLSLPSPIAGAGTVANAVNHCGTIVGFTETSDRYRHRATIWTKEGCDPPLK